jgi:hypothetical protein
MHQSVSNEVQNTLGNVNFPASKRHIIEQAKRQNISSDAIKVLEECPDMWYNNASEVFHECKKNRILKE